MHRRGMTLIEVLVALALAGIMFLAIFHVSTIAGKQVHVYIERYNGYSQIGYALDDMSLRLPSASEIMTPFTKSGALEIQRTMRFKGASNPYDVTPYQAIPYTGTASGRTALSFLRTRRMTRRRF